MPPIAAIGLDIILVAFLSVNGPVNSMFFLVLVG